MSNKKKGDNFKLGPIQSFRAFPENWNKLSETKQDKINAEYRQNLADGVKSKHLFYYAEVIYEDKLYVKQETPEPEPLITDIGKTFAVADKRKANIQHTIDFYDTKKDEVLELSETKTIEDIKEITKLPEDTITTWVDTKKKEEEKSSDNDNHDGIRPEFMDFLNNN